VIYIKNSNFLASITLLYYYEVSSKPDIICMTLYNIDDYKIYLKQYRVPLFLTRIFALLLFIQLMPIITQDFY